MNNMGREIMAALKRFQVGSDGDGVTVGGALVVSGSTTANTFSATAVNATGTVTFSGSVILSGTTTANTFSTDLITEKTSAAGVTIDGVLLKDGGASVSTLNTSGQVVFNDAGADVDFRVEGDADANLLFVDASADRVGIGTSSPSRRLTTQFDSATTYSSSEFSSTSNSLYLRNANTTTNAFTGIEFLVGTNGEAAISSIRTGDGEAALAFGTRGGGSRTERARINSAGYFKASNTGSYRGSTDPYHEINQSTTDSTLRIRATSSSYTNNIVVAETPSGTTNNSFYFYVGSVENVGDRFRVADSGNVTNTNNSYGSISDVKLKQDIVDAGSQWNDIKNLRVRKYHWKSDPNGFMQMGLVAQEAELVSPGLIEEHPDYEEVEITDEEGNVTTERQATGTTTKAIKYSVLYMKAVKALQEAIERIETLEAKNDALEARIAALEGAE
jgi:hypothetical protein